MLITTPPRRSVVKLSSIPGGSFYLHCGTVKYSKTPTGIAEQVDLLIERGMAVPSREDAELWLASVGYYRMSAYWLPHEEVAPEGKVRSKRFKAGTHFNSIRDTYIFDRRLRLLLMEAIERIEIHLRSRWTYRLVHKYGAHAHLDHSLFGDGLRHSEQLVRLARSVDSSKETFVIHYKGKYTEPYSPPLWVATELMSLGELSKWFQATKDSSVKSAVAADLGLPSGQVTEGVLQVLSFVRNICAHHARLWNRRILKRIPKINHWNNDLVLVEHKGQRQNDNHIYNVLIVLLRLLDHQRTDSSFRMRLRGLLEGVSSEHRRDMGFPGDWRQRPAWVQTGQR